MRNTVSGFVLCALAAGAPAAQVVDRVVATVGLEIVTDSDVRAAESLGLVRRSVPEATPPDALAYLIDRYLMLGEVDRYSAPAPPPALVDRRMAEVRARFASSDRFREALAQVAMTETRLRDLLADDLRIEAYVEQRFAAVVQPTVDEVQGYYRAHQQDFLRDGRPLPIEDVVDQVQARVAAERRRALVTDWLVRLRQRTRITLMAPGRAPSRP